MLGAYNCMFAPCKVRNAICSYLLILFQCLGFYIEGVLLKF